jgi:hypothetical protein
VSLPGASLLVPLRGIPHSPKCASLPATIPQWVPETCSHGTDRFEQLLASFPQSRKRVLFAAFFIAFAISRSAIPWGSRLVRDKARIARTKWMCREIGNFVSSARVGSEFLTCSGCQKSVCGPMKPALS